MYISKFMKQLLILTTYCLYKLSQFSAVYNETAGSDFDRLWILIVKMQFLSASVGHLVMYCQSQLVLQMLCNKCLPSLIVIKN